MRSAAVVLGRGEMIRPRMILAAIGVSAAVAGVLEITSAYSTFVPRGATVAGGKA